MAKLTTKARKALPKKDFAGPDRSYPVPDKGHARAAKSRASEMEHKGRISKSTEEHIDAKADRVLKKGDHAHAVKVAGKRYVTGGEIKKPRNT